jgi:uncharacterized protein YfaS (alpha-2-macroglobulin family)
VPIGSDGTGTFTLPAGQPVGNHEVSAQFDGTDTVAQSNVATTTLSVTKAVTSTTADPATSTAAKGSTLMVTVDVTGHEDALYPGGHVTVHISVGGRNRSKTVVMAQGDQGSVTVPVTVPLKTGQAQVTATYHGNDRFTASVSPPATVSVTTAH